MEGEDAGGGGESSVLLDVPVRWNRKLCRERKFDLTKTQHSWEGMVDDKVRKLFQNYEGWQMP